MQLHPYKSDTELLTCYNTDGNTEWLGILLQRYTRLLFGVCIKYLKNEHDAKDAVQQVFLKALSELQKYEVTYFKSWLYMIAKNYCLSTLRQVHKHTVDINNTTLQADDEATIKANLQTKENQLSVLETTIQLLNEEQRNCITLFYLQNKTYQAIASSTQYTVMQVKSHIQNGKRNLKILMQRSLTNE